MKQLPVSLMILLAVTCLASPARADDCGESDRAPLPSCASKGRIQGTQPGWFVQNSCSYPITVKFDKPGSDVRTDIPAGVRIDQETPPDETKVSCCPRYNLCAAPPVAKNWIKVTTPANVTFKQVSVGSAQHVWAVDTQGSPWRWTGSTWEKKVGTVASLSVDSSGVVWGLTAIDEIWMWRGGPDWVRGVGTLRSVSAVNSDVVWGMQASGSTYRWDPAIKDWIRVATPANVVFKQISAGSAQHVWAVDTQGSPWRWTGSTSEKKVGTVVSLDVGADGVVWGLVASGEIWKWQGGPDWVRGVGTLLNVSSVGGDVVWGVQANGSTFRWGS